MVITFDGVGLMKTAQAGFKFAAICCCFMALAACCGRPHLFLE
jgi:hypothetical protein